MTHWRAALEIGRWEFSRWFKVKGLLITLVMSVLISLAIAGSRYLLEQSDKRPVRLGLVHQEILPGLILTESRISFVAVQDTAGSALRETPGAPQLDGLLILRSPDQAELVVTRRASWEPELRELLTSERRRLKLESLAVTADELADALAPASLTVVYREAARGPSSVAEKITSGVLILLLIVGIFNSVALQLVGITGEKQLRVTEQIISAVTPQQWMDGKILGISAYSAVQTAVFAASTLVFIGIMQLFGESLSLPVEVTNPANIVVLVLCTVGGFLFWNTFLAALAATINDPNTSSRSAILFLPLVPSVGAGLAAMKVPESLLVRILTVLPITSPVALPVRLALGHVPLWEIALALAVLVASTWYLRLLAGRIFHLGMLMYGKEPGLREMWRWMKEA
jgi:ABC-2 type transport system permease protein